MFCLLLGKKSTTQHGHNKVRKGMLLWRRLQVFEQLTTRRFLIVIQIPVPTWQNGTNVLKSL